MPENKLFADITAIAHEAAKQPYDGKIYVTGHSEGLLREISDFAKRRDNDFTALVNRIADIKQEYQVNELSRLLALDAIVSSAVDTVNRNSALPTTREQIKKFLTGYLTSAPDQSPAVDQLSKKLDQLIISLTHTMHPTMYDTREVQEFRAELISMLEEKEGGKKKYIEYLLDGTQQLNKDKNRQSKIKKIFEEFIKKLVSGKAHISPKRPTTVAMETQIEKDNILKIRAQLKNVIAAWNDVIKEMQLPELKIDSKREQRIFEFRTWGQSADADGREKSTSQFLYECIQNNLEDVTADTPQSVKQHDGKFYDGATLDMRQNAKKVHLPFMDALIQVKYRNSEKEKIDGKTGKIIPGETIPGRNNEEGLEFFRLCKEFLDKNREYGVNDPAEFRYSMMRGFEENSHYPDHREKFISDIITLGSDSDPNKSKQFRLIPEKIGTNAIAFNQKFYPVKKEFLERYKKQIEDKGYDLRTIQYMEMGDVTVPYNLKEPDGKQMSLRGAWDTVLKLNDWQVIDNGLKYSHIPRTKNNSEDGCAVLDFWNHIGLDEILVQNFLQGCDMLKNGNGQNGERKPISPEDRATFTDTAKRLFIIKDAIKNYGPKVATRYQIANFSEPADFLILLKLFQDTGIATIENGVVKHSDLAIMPLLETGKDLENAEAIFTRLLANPLARSFWEARDNEVEIMIGHSDGAASVGDLASEWQIYKTTQALTKLFSDKKRWGKEFKVRFFHGRGRDVHRGGTIDPSLHARLLSPEETQRAIYDVTIQSDLPTDLAASKGYGEDYFTKILLSTLDAAVTAPERMSEEEKARLEPLEEAIDGIARRSGTLFDEHVRSNLAASMFTEDVPDNPYKTSRNSVRDTSEKNSGDLSKEKAQEKWDNIRAVPKALRQFAGDVSINNVGAGPAMDEHEAKNPALPLEKLCEHPVFEGIVFGLISPGMAHYDPAVARAYGEITKSKEFIEGTVIPQLEGLPEKLNRLAYKTGAVGRTLEHKRKIGQPGPVGLHTASHNDILDKIAHGIIVSSIKKGRPSKPDRKQSSQSDWIETLDNSVFVNAKEMRDVQLSWLLKERNGSALVA